MGFVELLALGAGAAAYFPPQDGPALRGACAEACAPLSCDRFDVHACAAVAGCSCRGCDCGTRVAPRARRDACAAICETFSCAAYAPERKPCPGGS